MATNKVYQGELNTLTPNTDAFMNLANNAGAFTPAIDLGATPRPKRYRWRMKTKAAAALAAGASMQIYLATSASNNNTDADGNLNNAGGALAAAASVNNLRLLGSIVADSTGNGAPQITSGEVTIAQRYVSVAVFNLLGQALTNTNTDHSFTLVPLYDDIQPAA